MAGAHRVVFRRPPGSAVCRPHPPGRAVHQRPLGGGCGEAALPELPSHIHLVPADAKINTYDLVEIADLGLVYTTTVGMEMVMSGIPVIVAGQTHYRAKGFTLDPECWQDYFELLNRGAGRPGTSRPSQRQVEQAWNYAYRFFFEYPHPFPWHLLQMWRMSGCLAAGARLSLKVRRITETPSSTCWASRLSGSCLMR